MSSFEFGGAFKPQVPDLPPPPSEAEMTLARLEILIRELGETLSRAPQPDIHVAAPDLTEMVNAVVGIKGPATAEEIADALARRLKFPEPQGSDPVLAELADTLKTLDFRLKGAFGGAASSGAQPADAARDTTLQQVRDRAEYPWSSTDRAIADGIKADTADIKANTADARRGVSDTRILMDYAGRADSLPVYVGKATQGTAQSSNTWSIQRLSYDGSNRLVDAQVLTGAWSDRATLGWV